MKISETLHVCLTSIKIFGFFLYDMINSNDKIHIPQFFAQLFRTEYFYQAIKDGSKVLSCHRRDF